jgi:hypothetical protein
MSWTDKQRQTLEDFYKQQDPSKLSKIDKIVAVFTPKELENSLAKKYGNAPNLTGGSSGKHDLDDMAPPPPPPPPPPQVPVFEDLLSADPEETPPPPPLVAAATVPKPPQPRKPPTKVEEEEVLEDVEYSGWLWKKAGKASKFDRRWCALKDNRLQYYKDNSAAALQPGKESGSLDMGDVKSVVEGYTLDLRHVEWMNFVPKKAHESFIVYTPQREWVFCAESDKLRDGWCDAMRKAAGQLAKKKLKRQGTGKKIFLQGTLERKVGTISKSFKGKFCVLDQSVLTVFTKQFGKQELTLDLQGPGLRGVEIRTLPSTKKGHPFYVSITHELTEGAIDDSGGNGGDDDGERMTSSVVPAKQAAGTTKLEFRAVSEGDRRQWVDSLDSVWATTDGNTGIMIAALQGGIDRVHELKKAGCNVNAENEKGETALMLAAGKGEKGSVEALLECGAKKETRCKKQWTAVLHAAAGGHAEVLAALKMAGADIAVRTPDGSDGPMVAAENVGRGAEDEYLSLMKLMGRWGVALDRPNAEGITALQIAEVRIHARNLPQISPHTFHSHLQSLTFFTALPVEHQGCSWSCRGWIHSSDPREERWQAQIVHQCHGLGSEEGTATGVCGGRLCAIQDR